MIRYHRRIRLLAASLSAVAGFVDAIGFIESRGFFVSFMSGNSTRLGVGLSHGTAPAVIAAGLIATFVAGVVLGSMTGHFAGSHRRTAVLVLVAALLGAAASLGVIGMFPAATICMALAMGSENAVFERDGDVQIGVTYMTGTLVKFGQRLAMQLRGGARHTWVPYLLLWLGLACGAWAGAAAHAVFGPGALWIAAAAAAGLAIFAAATRHHPDEHVG